MAIISYLEQEVLNPNSDKGRDIFRGDYSTLNYAPREMGVISSAQSNRPILMSYGMGPCIAVCGYDSSAGIGFLTHNSALTDVNGLHDLILKEMRKIIGRNTQLSFHLVGGWKGGEKDDWNSGILLKRIEEYITSNFPEATIDKDVLDPMDYRRGKSFALDTRDGKTYCIESGEKLQSIPPGYPI